MKILMILASENFRDSEYIIPRSFWENLGATVMTAAQTIDAVGRFGYKLHTDLLLSGAAAWDFDAVFFVGGGGCLALSDDPDAKRLAWECIDQKKPLGAICAAPILFLQWGILKGKTFTGWNGDKELEKLGKTAGATYKLKSTLVDGTILTAEGPSVGEEAAVEFFKLIKKVRE